METINHIIYLYWNHQIEHEQMLEYLKDVPPEILAEFIDTLVNHIPKAMKFAISNDRLEYPNGREMPTRPIEERIREAAKRFCPGHSVKNWFPSATALAKNEGLCEDWEVYTFDRIAREMQQKTLAAKPRFI